MRKVKEVASMGELLKDLDEAGINGGERYQAVSGYISAKARLRDIPVNGSFELTPFCNLDCKMCYVHLTANQLQSGERLRTVDEFKTIIDQAVDAGMMFADLTGGECLTYPGFREIYIYLTSLGIRPNVLTNGRLLTEDMVSFFSEYPPSVVQITLYGSCDDAYERVCGHRAFREVMDGIERVKKAGLNSYVTVTPNRYMQEDASALLELLHSLGMKYYIGGALLSAREETGRRIEDYRIELDDRIALLNEEAKHIATSSIPEKTHAEMLYLPPKTNELRGLQCASGHSTFHINWRGEMCPCIGFSHSVHFDVLKNSFAKAWEQVRQTMANYQPPSECVQCKLSKYCTVCPAEKTGSLLRGELNRSVCAHIKRYMEEGIIALNSEEAAAQHSCS